jgi:hypothetical protein
MTDLPTIPHATVEPAAEGLLAKPLADTAEAHTAFQQAVKAFSLTQTNWEIISTQAGWYESWEKLIFGPYL